MMIKFWLLKLNDLTSIVKMAVWFSLRFGKDYKMSKELTQVEVELGCDKNRRHVLSTMYALTLFKFNKEN
jgi:hypothetical protein